MNSETLENIGLSSLDLAPSYRTGQSDPVGDFYKPCIEYATEYDRAVGYFRSTIYLVIGDSIVDFAMRGGKIRLICSPVMYEDDATSIESAYEERQSKLASAVELEIDQMLGTPNGMYPTKVLATLVLVGSLDIKLALRRANQGLYHEKIGIFRDDKNAVSFIGSANETWNGWHERGNFESLEVFCTWRDAFEKERVRRHEDYFNKLWNGKVLGVTVVQFPEAARKCLIQYAHQSLDEIDIGQMRNLKKEIRHFHRQRPDHAASIPCIAQQHTNRLHDLHRTLLCGYFRRRCTGTEDKTEKREPSPPVSISVSLAH